MFVCLGKDVRHGVIQERRRVTRLFSSQRNKSKSIYSTRRVHVTRCYACLFRSLTLSLSNSLHLFSKSTASRPARAHLFLPRVGKFLSLLSSFFGGVLVLLIAVMIIKMFVMNVVANFNPCNAFSRVSTPLPNPMVFIFLCVYSTPVSFFTDWLCPRMRHRVVKRPSTPTGPRAWIRDVETPTSAP